MRSIWRTATDTWPSRLAWSRSPWHWWCCSGHGRAARSPGDNCMAVVTIAHEELSRPITDARARTWCAQLEAGDILFFPETPVPIPPDDLAFLLGPQQTDSSLHKNIAYKPNIDKLSGVDTKTADAAAVKRLQSIMRAYSQHV